MYICDENIIHVLWVLIPVIIIGFLITTVLCLPIHLHIDTDKSWYGMKFGRWMFVRILFDNSSFKILIRLWFWEFQIETAGNKKVKKPIKVKTKKWSGRPVISFETSVALIKSFRINECVLILDTEDYPLNGILYPVFYWLDRYSGWQFEINFEGRNTLKLDIENSAARIGWVYVYYTFIKNK